MPERARSIGLRVRLGDSSHTTLHGWGRASEGSFTDFWLVETDLAVVLHLLPRGERDFWRAVTGFRPMEISFRGMKSDFREGDTDFRVMRTRFRRVESDFRTIDYRLPSGRNGLTERRKWLL